MATLPAKNILDGSTAPTTSTMKTAMGQLRDFLAGLLGADGTASTARSALGLPELASGTYIPTLTNVTNLDSTTAVSSQYMRVGNVVTVSGAVGIDPTASGNTVFRMSLPISSDLGLGTHLGGTFAAASTSTTQAGSISADTTNDQATFQLFSNVTTNLTYYFTFTYRVV